jgi:hypothetical protein
VLSRGPDPLAAEQPGRLAQLVSEG